MRYKTIGKNLSPLCFLPSGRLVGYRHGEVFVIENGKVIKSFPVFNGKKERKRIVITGRAVFISAKMAAG